MPKIYTTEILGQVYKYRGATRGEMEVALLKPTQTELEDFLFRTCVIYPRNIDLNTCLAGIPTVLGEKILEASGMTEKSSAKFQKEAEEWAITTSGKIEALMMGVLHLDLEKIRSLDPIDWYKSAVAAQMLAAAMYNLDMEKYLSLGEKKAPSAKNLLRQKAPPPPTARIPK